VTTTVHVAELLRPDDLLDLVVGVVGPFELDTSGPEPVLRRTDAAQAGYMLVALGSQWIGEQAFQEVEGIPAPGAAAARINNPSWLAFEIPAALAEIPYTLAGLLDWSALQLLVSPLVGWGSGGSHAGQPPSIVAPGLAETALELPYRLVVSPGPDTRWLHVDHPVTYGGRTELWHTELAVEGSEPLWAIWSPDFSVPFPQGDGLATSSTAEERAQLVALTVGFALPLRLSGQPIVPSPLRVRRLFLTALGSWLHWDGSWRAAGLRAGWFGRGAEAAVSVASRRLGAEREQATTASAESAPSSRRAAPAEVEQSLLPHLQAVKGAVEKRLGQVMAQAVGRLEPITGEVLPHAPPAGRQELPVELVAWTHIGTGGRDQYVKIVELGWLYPFGHQATKTKITERRFEVDPQQPGNGPVAFLVQYEYITVTQPEVSFAGSWETQGGRAMPLASVRLATRVTPHLLPANQAPALISNAQKASWVVDEQHHDVVFHAVGNDRNGREVPFSASLVFMPDSTVEADAGPVEDAYAHSGSPPGSRRECPVPRQLMTFAPPDTQAGSEDTALTTETLTFDSAVSGRTFSPTLHDAAVRVPAVSRLTGQDVPMTIGLYGDYVTQGIVAVHGVFAELTAPAGVGVTADQAGGFLTPNLAVTGLQRGSGPVAGNLAKAASDQFEPADFFNASPPVPLDPPKLFDAIALADLLSAGPGATAPKLTSSIARDQAGNPLEAVTTLSWTPIVSTDDVPAGPLTLTPGPGSTLKVTAQVRTPLGQSSKPIVDVRGELSDFAIALLNVVKVTFTSFSIHSRSGDKPDVDLKLPETTPVSFEGDLAFLNTLAELFPPLGLSDPPYVDVTPTELVAGFGLALPPAEIGVLTLHDLRLDTAFRLPFLSGRPALDLAFSSREHPLVLTVSALGGGGFLHLELDTTGVIMIEGSLEFGGEFALDIGVASGGVHLMAGIYLRIDKTTTPESSQLTGFVDLGGEVSVLGLVSVSVDFHLSLTYVIKPVDKAQGRATLTVSISIAFFSTSVSMSVERSFGSGPGDPSAADVFPQYADWQRYALAFA
jgi:hypothetical protein